MIKTILHEKQIKHECSIHNFDILQHNHLEDAVKHMQQHDPKLAIYLDEAAITAFRERMGKEDGSNPFM